MLIVCGVVVVEMWGRVVGAENMGHIFHTLLDSKSWSGSYASHESRLDAACCLGFEVSLSRERKFECLEHLIFGMNLFLCSQR